MHDLVDDYGPHDNETKVRLNDDDHDAYRVMAARAGVGRGVLMRAVLRDWLRQRAQTLPAMLENGRRV